MRRLASLLLVMVLAVGLGGAGQPAPKRLIEFSDAERADLDRVSAYLNSIHALKGSFIQIDPDDRIEQGRFYLKKPGRLRFEYLPPNLKLIVADGHTIAVANRKLKTVDRYPLSGTPLELVLADVVDLRHSDVILAVNHQPGLLIINARSSTNRSRANISLTFTAPELELRKWTVLDDQGLVTTVLLNDLEPGAEIPDWLFVLKDMKGPVGVKPRD